MRSVSTMWHRSDLLAGLLLSGLFVLCGCGGQPVVGPGPVVGSAKETAARDEELHNGLRYVRLMNEYDYDKASEKAISSLNSWLAASDDQREYKIDPLRAQ